MAEAPAFATATDLAARLGRAVWTGLELARVEELLADATAHLRGIIGWQVSPPAEVTIRVPVGRSHRLQLPGAPVTSVTSVSFAGTEILAGSWELVEGELVSTYALPVGSAVTYSVGYTDPPRDLVSWTCVLASQALSVLEELGSLGAGGVSGIAIDDFRKNWSQGGDGAGFVLPVRIEEKLRQQYGTGAYVTGRR